MSTVRTLAELVKLEHTIFALPTAYAGMLLGARAADVDVTVAMVLWILAAMVGARTLAMGLNRVIDAGIDARNPRTANREIPRGAVSRLQVWVLCAASLALLLVAVWQLDPVTRLLWPIPVALFVLYPFTKRFTWLCHIVLGISIGLAPLAAWLAAGGSGSDPAPYLLWVAITLWIAGFDVIYATADVEFDRSQGLSSMPARFGIARALTCTRVAHVGTVLAVGAVGVLCELNILFWASLALAAALLVRENTLVSADDLTRIDHAFFTINSYVGVVLGLGLMLGTL